MHLGLSSFTYGWAVGVRGFPAPAQPMDELALLERCRALGVDRLQVGDNLPMHRWDAGRLAAFAAAAHRAEIAIEVGARRLDDQRLADYIAIARQMNASLIRFIIDDEGYHPAGTEVVEIVRRARVELGECVLGIENHDRFSAAELRAIIQAIDSPQVGICLDTANSIGAGEDLSTVLTALADYTVNLHIKDFAIERLPYLMGFTVEGRPAGSGRLDVAALWRRMAQVPRCRSAIIELWTPPILDASGAVDMEATVAKEAIWARISLQHVRAAAQADRP